MMEVLSNFCLALLTEENSRKRHITSSELEPISLRLVRMSLEEKLQAPLASKAKKAIIREAVEAFCTLLLSLPVPRSDSGTPEAPAAPAAPVEPATPAPAPAPTSTFAAAFAAAGAREGQGESFVPPHTLGSVSLSEAPAPGAPAAPTFTFADDDPDSTQVRAVQIEPTKSKLKAPGSMLLKAKICWNAFKLCLCRYTQVDVNFAVQSLEGVPGRGLHSSTFHLSLSRFCM